jgi:hypothetical protein
MLISWTDQEFDEEGRIKTIMGCMYVSDARDSDLRI